MMFCVTFGDVCAEKLSRIDLNACGSSEPSRSRTTSVLPVPVLPQKSTGTPCMISVSAMYPAWIVSSVGTKMSLKTAPFGTWYSGTVVIHADHA